MSTKMIKMSTKMIKMSTKMIKIFRKVVKLFKKCKLCGSYLDAGERCDCAEKNFEEKRLEILRERAQRKAEINDPAKIIERGEIAPEIYNILMRQIDISKLKN